jgi:hypothetical protein
MGASSDPTAEKPVNGVGRPKPELVEPREGAKENTGRVSTRRTPSRISVSPGLDRVRKAAGPNQRFAVKHPRWEPDAGCDRRSRYELASASLVRPKPSRQGGSESCGRRGNAGSEA